MKAPNAQRFSMEVHFRVPNRAAIEDALSAAVTAMVETKPAAPVAFLARHLTAQAGMVSTAGID